MRICSVTYSDQACWACRPREGDFIVTMDAMVRRTDTVSKMIKATPEAIYRAFLEPQSLVSWLPPADMKGALLTFEPWIGGAYRMALTYEKTGHGLGKSSADSDI